jgi:uncharacterized protein with von Willebrand factor type A (vWA) domain
MSTKDELFIRSGLAKSAFRESIYEQLPWHFYMPYATEVQKLTRSLARVLPKIYQAHDAFMMFYKPYELVHTSLKKTNRAAPAWHAIVLSAVNKAKFYDINKTTAGSLELSILSAYKFLTRLFRLFSPKELEDVQEKMKKGLLDQQGTEIWLRTFQNEVEKAVEEVEKAVEEFKKEKEEAEVALAGLLVEGGLGFLKDDVLSVLRFLKNPDDFRRRVRLLKYARVFFGRFSATLPVSFSHEQLASLAGGVWGVGRVSAHSRIADILPSELAMLGTGNPVARALFAVKLASQQLAAYQHAAAVRPVLFVDKSGSMAENYEQYIPKISVAAGLAFAMHRKFNANVYLFDTELTPVKPADIVKTLLTIEADGGTDVDPVLQEIVRIGKADYVYIIISDGITSADNSVLENFKRSGLAARTKLILVPPASESYNWVSLLRQHGNVYYARDVAQFEKAVKSALG